MRAPLIAAALVTATLVPASARAQWTLQNSGTTADLRGIHAVSAQIAWASGSGGTILRTTDGGAHWQHCTTPPDAAQLDFRGIQAFDANTAIAMSSGKGDLSRLYKTTDACHTWKLVFTNPDKDGFWDAVSFPSPSLGFIFGDPVRSKRAGRKPQFVVYLTNDGGNRFERFGYPTLEANPAKAGAFAASNSSLLVSPSEDIHGWLWAGIGGLDGPAIFCGGYTGDLTQQDGTTPITDVRWEHAGIPLASGESAGVFSIAVRGHDTHHTPRWFYHARLIAVGGDYLLPNRTNGTAAFSEDGGRHWLAADTPPHGYRSAVAYDAATKTWITVGPNGTDISTDDGRNWQALKPSANDAPHADQQWNALSLPFVVGPHGRIGVLEPAALAVAAKPRP